MCLHTCLYKDCMSLCEDNVLAYVSFFTFAPLPSHTKFRSLLFQIGEQLASQHMRVLGTQQGGATAEQLCAERIAEQQLRIKQVR